MTFKNEQPYKDSHVPALLSALIWIVFFPVWLVVVILYEAQAILWSRRLGVSRTALSPMKLIKVLPNHWYFGLYAKVFPILMGHR